MLIKELTKQKPNAINMHQKRCFQETQESIIATAQAIAAALSKVQFTSLNTLKCLREFKPSWNKTKANKWRQFYWGSERSGLNWPRKKNSWGKTS